MMTRLTTLLRHCWMDASDSRRLIPDDMARRLSERIGASEARHTGEIRICVEASLPAHRLWRPGPSGDMRSLTRERALQWFSRLGVWDTEHNNGVLIYLLLAERRIECVADRSLRRRVDDQRWQSIVDQLGVQWHQARYEDGLTQALEEVSALLVEHFPAVEGHARANELPDVLIRT